GQGEDVEADVAGEHRIASTEGGAVEEPEHQVPGRSGTEPRDQGDDEGNRKAEAAKRAGKIHPRLILGKAEYHRIWHQSPLGQPEVAIEYAEGDAGDSHEEQQSGEKRPGEDGLVADFLEPPPVGQNTD